MTRNEKPTVAQRVAFVFRTTIVSLLLIVIIIGLAGGGYLIFQELNRSVNSVATRTDVNKENINALRDRIDRLDTAVADEQARSGELRATTAELDTRLTSLQEQLAADLSRQEEMLTALSASLETAAAASDQATEDTAALGTAFVALQGDLNEVNGRLDELGGDIDSLRANSDAIGGEVALLNQGVISATQSASGVTDMQQTLALFHVWELLARARLRLLENNVGLATTDLQLALRSVDTLVGQNPGDDDLRVIQTRLALTLSSLPNSPAAAAQDLETAWSGIDAILTARTLPAAVLVEETAVEPKVETTPTPAPSGGG
ncbi:MAG: hypothetical protein ACE5FD_12870 [Anaerolineae bacterium]